MNGPQDNAAFPDDEAPVALGQDTAEAKPARRKRAVKAAPATEVEPVDAAGADGVLADAPAEVAPKPARRRKAVTKADDSADTPPDTPQEAALAPQAPSQPVAENMPVQPEAPQVAAPVADGGDESGDAESTGDNAPVEGAAASGERSGRRRNRRDRRRGRGDGSRVDDGEGVQGLDGDATDDESAVEGEAPPVLVIPAEAGELFAQVVSGEYDAAVDDAEAAAALAAPPKRVLQPEPDAPKLHKVLAQAGIGSRRDMEQMILDGEISVNGQPAHIGQRISFGDHIKVKGKPVKVRITPPPPRVIAYHKPAGEVVTHDDPQHRPTVFRRLPRLPHGKWQSVGRLDLNTEGLLLFTNSGELANQLMHPRFGVEREYAVRVLGTLDDDAKRQLLEGVTIDGQTASFRSIEDGGGEGANHWYRVVITEGRNREVRKLFDAVGLTVSRLIRIRYGSVVLPLGLKRGVWADLSEADVRVIRQLAGGAREGRDEPRGNERGRNKRRNDRGDRNAGDARGQVPKQRGFDQPRQEVRRPDVERDPDRDDDDDFDPARIPNPLEQTFDKRFVQNPRSPAGGRGFRQGGGGFGAGGSAPDRPKKGDPREPDPLQTSLGFIGADAYRRKSGRGSGGGGGGGGRGGNRGGGSFGGGGRRGR